MLVAVGLCLMSSLATAQSLEAMTYNIRFDTPRDGENTWSLRKENLVDQIRFHEPDVLGIQEGEYHQVEYLDAALPEFSYVGVGRDDGENAGEFSAIFFDKRRLTALDSGTFWLSRTPNEPSRSWDAAIKRICTYARFRDMDSSRMFWVFNTHFDHIGVLARRRSARLVVNQIATLNTEGEPVLLMGDFNAVPGSEPIQTILRQFTDTKVEAESTFGPEGTGTGFYVTRPPSRRIDYIFASYSDWRVTKHAVLTDSRDQRYFSDHLPVFIEVEAGLN